MASKPSFFGERGDQEPDAPAKPSENTKRGVRQESCAHQNADRAQVLRVAADAVRAPQLEFAGGRTCRNLGSKGAKAACRERSPGEKQQRSEPEMQPAGKWKAPEIQKSKREETGGGDSDSRSRAAVEQSSKKGRAVVRQRNRPDPE